MLEDLEVIKRGNIALEQWKDDDWIKITNFMSASEFHTKKEDLDTLRSIIKEYYEGQPEGTPCITNETRIRVYEILGESEDPEVEKYLKEIMAIPICKN